MTTSTNDIPALEAISEQHALIGLPSNGDSNDTIGPGTWEQAESIRNRINREYGFGKHH